MSATVDEGILNRVRAAMRSVRVPVHHDKVGEVGWILSLRPTRQPGWAGNYVLGSPPFFSFVPLPCPWLGSRAAPRTTPPLHTTAPPAPTPMPQVYKEECMFSYDTPESAGGLYVNLNSFQVV